MHDNMHLENIPLAMRLMPELNGDAASDKVIEEPLEMGRMLANFGRERRGAEKIMKGNLERTIHGASTCEAQDGCHG
jgi:hypothetical protein